MQGLRRRSWLHRLHHNLREDICGSFLRHDGLCAKIPVPLSSSALTRCFLPLPSALPACTAAAVCARKSAIKDVEGNLDDTSLGNQTSSMPKKTSLRTVSRSQRAVISLPRIIMHSAVSVIQQFDFEDQI